MVVEECSKYYLIKKKKKGKIMNVTRVIAFVI